MTERDLPRWRGRERIDAEEDLVIKVTAADVRKARPSPDGSSCPIAQALNRTHPLLTFYVCNTVVYGVPKHNDDIAYRWVQTNENRNLVHQFDGSPSAVKAIGAWVAGKELVIPAPNDTSHLIGDPGNPHTGNKPKRKRKVNTRPVRHIDRYLDD